MTDILTLLAAITSKEEIERIAKDYAERFGMSHKAGPGFRLAHEQDMAKGIKAAIYESNADLVALVQEAVGEIERLSGALTHMVDVYDPEKTKHMIKVRQQQAAALYVAKQALNPQEAAP